MLTIDPPPSALMRGPQCFIPSQTPVWSTETTRCQCSSVSSSTVARLPSAALFTSARSGAQATLGLGHSGAPAGSRRRRRGRSRCAPRRRPAARPPRSRQASAVEVGDRDPGALGGQAFGDVHAEPSGGSGQQYDASGQAVEQGVHRAPWFNFGQTEPARHRPRNCWISLSASSLVTILPIVSASSLALSARETSHEERISRLVSPNAWAGPLARARATSAVRRRYLVVIDDLGDQPPVAGFLGVEHPAADCEFERALLADCSGQQVGDAAVRRQADGGVGHDELGRFSGDHQVRVEHECQARSGYGAVNTGNHRFGQLREPTQLRLQLGGQGEQVPRPVIGRCEGRHVASCAEPRPPRGQRDRADSRRLRLLDRGTKCPRGRQVERVGRLRSLQDDPADRAVRLEAHSARLSRRWRHHGSTVAGPELPTGLCAPSTITIFSALPAGRG